MKVKVDVKGMDTAIARMAGLGKQVNFATARALTQTAHAVNNDVKTDLKSGIQGGPTAYTLRAFQVTGATRDNLESSVALRNTAPEGGTNYTSALGHLFGGGRRRWKKLEGWLSGRGLLPAGMMIAPGPKILLDARGNIRRRNLEEMLKILGSETRNLTEWRKSGRGKSQAFKEIGFFVCRPGDRSGLPPGIWRRIKTGSSSVVEPWIMYIQPTAYRQQFDLEKIATKTVSRVFSTNFNKSLADALRAAR